MKHLLLLIFGVIVLSAREYSLEEMLDSAYENSPRLAIASLEVTKSNDAVAEAQRKMLPSLSLRSEYDYAITPYHDLLSVLDGSSFINTYTDNVLYQNRSRGDSVIVMTLDHITREMVTNPPKNTFQFGFDLHQTVWDQNKYRHAVEYRRVEGRALICHWQEVRMRVKADVTRLYCMVQLALKQIDVEKDGENLAQKRHTQSLVHFQSSTFSEMDTLNSFVDYYSASIRVEDAQRNAREVLRNLITVVGLEEDPDSVILADSLVLEPFSYEYERLEERFLYENKELLQLRNDVDLAEIRVEMARAAYLPSIHAGLSFDWHARFDHDRPLEIFPDRAVYLGLRYELVSFGQRQLRIRQRDADVRMAKHRFEYRTKQLTSTLKSHFERLQSEMFRVHESKKISHAAQRACEISLIRYEDGLISQIDMEQSEQQLRQTRLMYLTAVYRYNSTLIDLRMLGADYLYDLPVDESSIKLLDLLQRE